MALVVVSGVHVGPDRASSPDRATLNALMDRAAASARAGRWIGPGPILAGGTSGPGQYRTDWSRLFEPTPGDALAAGRLQRDLSAVLAQAGGYSLQPPLAHDDGYGTVAEYESPADRRDPDASAGPPAPGPLSTTGLGAPLVIGVAAATALLLVAAAAVVVGRED
jgi:hypothetical protein